VEKSTPHPRSRLCYKRLKICNTKIIILLYSNCQYIAGVGHSWIIAEQKRQRSEYNQNIIIIRPRPKGSENVHKRRAQAVPLVYRPAAVWCNTIAVWRMWWICGFAEEGLLRICIHSVRPPHSSTAAHWKDMIYSCCIWRESDPFNIWMLEDVEDTCVRRVGYIGYVRTRRPTLSQTSL